MEVKEERVIEPSLSSYALYRCHRRRRRDVLRRHVAVTPNNATKGINDGKENSYVGSNLPSAKVASLSTCTRYATFVSPGRNTPACAACAGVGQV